MGRRQRERSILPRRVVRREADGTLYDIDECRSIKVEDLRNEVRAGRRFRASRYDTGGDCTYEILTEILQGATLRGPGTPGVVSGLHSLAMSIGDVLGHQASVVRKPQRDV
jgi:polyhydroxyalkanoate synthesis regulator protein